MAFDIDGLGEKSITEFHEIGMVKAPGDIFRLASHEAEIAKREGWGATSARKLSQAIETRRTISLPRFIYALGIRRVGENNAKLLARHYGSIEVVSFSGKTGAGVQKLLPAVRHAAEIWNSRVPTGELNRWFDMMLERHAPPLVQGRRLKLRYITQVKSRPPTFLVFGTRAEQLPDDYKRYLVNGLRETFGLTGVPIRLQLRGTKNPYADERD